MTSASTTGSGSKPPLPDFEKGIEYWTNVDATVDGVLGGFGDGPLPRVDQLGSRQFLLSLIPTLQRFPSPLVTESQVEQSSSSQRRYTALDVGAGVGRVTAEVLLPLFDDVVTIEPVKHFIEAARKNSSSWRHFEDRRATKKKQVSALGNDEGGKRVWFVQGALNDLDPARPLDGRGARSLGVLGGKGADETFGERVMGGVVHDIVWCQWCLGHLSRSELVTFLQKARSSLREDPQSASYVVVKENVCDESPDGSPHEEFDDEDSSLTRSEGMWKSIFEEVGLKIMKEEVQHGLPAGLFMVKSWALR